MRQKPAHLVFSRGFHNRWHAALKRRGPLLQLGAIRRIQDASARSIFLIKAVCFHPLEEHNSRVKNGMNNKRRVGERQLKRRPARDEEELNLGDVKTR